MSRILVLGSTGMLGHKMLERLRLHYEDVIGLSRAEGLCTHDAPYMRSRLIVFRPDVIVNCVGLIKQRPQDVEESIQTNALFPHFLQRVSQDLGTRLIHFSTDCVFSGKQGNYTEADTPDPGDLYGRTKLLGEIAEGNVLTLRTSIIGRERANGHGLLEWFLRQTGPVPGYTNAIFSGVTTNWLADLVSNLIRRHTSLRGLYQVAAGPISKFQLLELMREVYDRQDIQVFPTMAFPCDRSLNAAKFRLATWMSTPDLENLLFIQAEEDKESDYAV